MKKGSHHTPETLAKMRAAWTPERRAKQADTMRGNNSPMRRPEVAAKSAAAKRGQKLPSMTGDNNPMRRPEVAEKAAAANRGKKRSLECRMKIAAAMRGKKHRPEHTAKRAAAIRGKKRPDITGDKSPMKRLEVRAKQLENTPRGDKSPMRRPEQRARVSGAGNPAWLGGISNKPYAWTFNEELKEEVRRRDGHKCQLCGVPQVECKRKLSVHHINYDKRDSDPLNLITLCPSCHSRTNKRRKYWTKYFQRIQERKI